MTSLPPGVTRYDETEAKAQAARNLVVLGFGGPKSGKTHFAMQSQRPLYIVYLDTNPGLQTHLLKSCPTWGDEVYSLVLKPMNYEDLTEAEAAARVTQVEKFAEWAKENAKERVAAGQYGGTFLLDGATYLKGYYEKAILGESSTLGFRAKKGQKGGPSTYEYAMSNAALFDFLAGFVNEPLDFIGLFEGRPVYVPTIGADGKESSKKTDRWRTTRPDRLPYAISAEVELLKTLERMDPSNNQSPLVSTHQIRIVLNSENSDLDHMVLPALGFQGLKELLLAPTVGDIVLRHESEIIRANDAGLGGEEVE